MYACMYGTFMVFFIIKQFRAKIFGMRCFQANNSAEYLFLCIFFFLISGSNWITEMKESQTYPVHQNENPFYESTADETRCNPLYDRCRQFFVSSSGFYKT